MGIMKLSVTIVPDGTKPVSSKPFKDLSFPLKAGSKRQSMAHFYWADPAPQNVFKATFPFGGVTAVLRASYLNT